MGQLQNKIALVTGGSRGIGKAIALAFGGEGASVAFTYRSASSAADEVLHAIHASGQKGGRVPIGREEA